MLGSRLGSAVQPLGVRELWLPQRMQDASRYKLDGDSDAENEALNFPPFLYGEPWRGWVSSWAIWCAS